MSIFEYNIIPLKGDSYELFISVHEIMSRKDGIDFVQRAEINKRHKCIQDKRTISE